MWPRGKRARHQTPIHKIPDGRACRKDEAEFLGNGRGLAGLTAASLTCKQGASRAGCPSRGGAAWKPASNQVRGVSVIFLVTICGGSIKLAAPFVLSGRAPAILRR